MFDYIYTMSTVQHLQHTIGNVKQVWDFYNLLPLGIAWNTRDVVVTARNSLSLSRATTYRYIKMLEDKGLVEQVSRGTRKLTRNEIVNDVSKKDTLLSLSEKVRGRKTFVKTRH